MDTEQTCISEATTKPASGAFGSQDFVVASVADATLDGPFVSGGCPIFCMPSAGAIADAIIRRTLAEVRG